MMELTAEDAAIEELVTHPFLSLSLDSALSQLALQHVDVIAHDVVAADKPVDLSLLRNVTERLAAHEEWTKDHDKIATRIVKEFSRTIARAVSASMMRGENVKLFVHLDENLAPLLAFIAAVSEKAKTSSATELMRWTPFVVHASAFFCCGQLPAYEAMRCTELATRVLDTCQRLHQSSCRAELLALVFERLVALTSQDVSKDGWTSDHSIAKHVLEWVVLQVAFPHFGGDALGRVLALVFPLVDDLTDATQLVGARMLLHIAKNVTDTELRWYTDVLLEVLRGAITTRKPVTLDCLVETLVVSLEKLSPPGDFQYYDRFVPRLLNDCSLSSDVALRVLYTRHFRAVATRLGAPHSIYLIRFLQPLLKVLVASFESVNASLVIETLTTLRLVVISAWPRIPTHSEEILVGVLKAVALCEAFQGTEPHLPTTAERTEILCLSEEIVALLMKLSSSSVTVMLQRVADESHALKPFASRALTAE